MNIVMMLKNEETLLPECCCQEMEKALKDHEHPIYYSSAFNEYGIQLTSKFEYNVLSHCPWCGCKLPASRRDEWFENLEKQGVEPWENNIPNDYLSSKWWSNA